MSNSLAPRRFLNNINGKSFEECITFINQQASELGVTTTGGHDLGAIIYAWAQHLSQQSKTAESVFMEAIALMDIKEPKAAYNKLSKLNDTLVGKQSILDRFMGGSNALANTIKGHPFYETFQHETLATGFTYVKQVYDEFAKVDAAMKKVKGKLPSIQGKLSSLKEPNSNLSDIHIPVDMSSNMSVANSIAETSKLLDIKPELFYSATATGALADAAAKELYGLWQQSFMAFDLAASRWLCIAYFGLMLNAAVSSSTSNQVFAHMIAATNDQMKQFGNLLTAVASSHD